MDDYMDLAPENDSGGVERNPQDEGLQRLYNGIQEGFIRVMAKLSDVDAHLDSVPTRTADALSGQRGLSEGEGGGRVNALVAVSEANRIADILTTQNQELEQEKTLLEARIQAADEDIERRATAEAELKKELLDLRREVARLQQKEAQFRDIILSSAGTQKITDQEVIQAFSDLRQKVQQLASSPAFDLTAIPTIAPDPKKQKMRHFYTVCRGLSRSRDVGNRLKAQIFTILYQWILSGTSFGLKRENAQDEKKEELWYIDEYLARFEELLSRDGRVNEGVIADWRICTLDCVDLLKLPEEFSRFVARKMDIWFEPLISKRATKSQQDEMWEKMVEVCQKSVQLKMMMQRSKEGYIVTIPDVKEYPIYSDVEHFADSMGVENGTSLEASDEIVYLLFGALTKHAKHLGERKILVKAEVILKKKQRK